MENNLELQGSSKGKKISLENLLLIALQFK
jgi:hypothetical protein